ncbi:hypothetical protein DPMN_094232 [Dreissena polymorpha]|uniref:Uncharacterized protein n=1 Tax=Dreissena polymorpha TaxID=45954 RepID=A0A9D4R2P1_DREPO|nr:hypothetical protein DPMN_094232 [Dreissena polymorpha]
MVRYPELMQRLMERFGAKDLPTTVDRRFKITQHEVGESQEGWSDRALTLATMAFRKLASTYATEKEVTKFCQRLLDREAGKHVSLHLSTSMGDVMNKAKLFNYVQLACTSATRGSKMGKQEESRGEGVTW